MRFSRKKYYLLNKDISKENNNLGWIADCACKHVFPAANHQPLVPAVQGQDVHVRGRLPLTHPPLLLLLPALLGEWLCAVSGRVWLGCLGYSQVLAEVWFGRILLLSCWQNLLPPQPIAPLDDSCLKGSMLWANGYISAEKQSLTQSWNFMTNMDEFKDWNNLSGQ